MPIEASGDYPIYWRRTSRRVGGGRPTVLIIQGLGHQIVSWPPSVYRALEAHARLIMFDNRDTGLSAKRFVESGAVVGDYGLSAMAADAARVARAAARGPVHVLGLSLGGMVAQLFCLNHPDLVRGAVFGMTSCLSPDSPPGQSRALEALFDSDPDESDEAFAKRAVWLRHNIGSFPPLLASEAEIRRVNLAARRRYAYPDGAQRLAGAIFAEPPWWERLGEIACPAVVLEGMADPLFPVGNGAEIANRLANAELIQVPRLGHEISTPMAGTLADAVARCIARG